MSSTRYLPRACSFDLELWEVPAQECCRLKPMITRTTKIIRVPVSLITSSQDGMKTARHHKKSGWRCRVRFRFFESTFRGCKLAVNERYGTNVFSRSVPEYDRSERQFRRTAT